MPYNPALDGLRAIAIAAVVAFHSGAPLVGGGYLGVDLFFVLSGYLITTILRREYDLSGSIRLARFYWRRAMRLYPTLLLVLLVFVLSAPFLWPDVPAIRYAAWAALYLSDYSRAFLGEPIILSYTWSLSVEEHFYLLWPLLLPAVVRSRHPVRILLAAYLLATVWRWFNYFWLGWEPAYFRFDTRLSGLILGCMLSFRRPDVSRFMLPAAGLTAVLFATPTFHATAGLLLAVPLGEIAAAVLVTGCVDAAGRVSWLSATPLVYIGRLSYGIYLWHFPIIYWIRDHYSWPVALIGAAAASVALAALTFHLVDAPIRARRTRSHLPALPERVG